jgi:hypothetical protein
MGVPFEISLLKSVKHCTSCLSVGVSPVQIDRALGFRCFPEGNLGVGRPCHTEAIFNSLVKFAAASRRCNQTTGNSLARAFASRLISESFE